MDPSLPKRGENPKVVVAAPHAHVRTVPGMSTTDPLNIAGNAAKAKKATVDGNSIERHNLTEQIEADKHVQANAAAKSPTMGIRFGRFRHGGTS